MKYGNVLFRYLLNKVRHHIDANLCEVKIVYNGLTAPEILMKLLLNSWSHVLKNCTVYFVISPSPYFLFFWVYSSQSVCLTSHYKLDTTRNYALIMVLSSLKGGRNCCLMTAVVWRGLLWHFREIIGRSQSLLNVVIWSHGIMWSRPDKCFCQCANMPVCVNDCVLAAYLCQGSYGTPACFRTVNVMTLSWKFGYGYKGSSP